MKSQRQVAKDTGIPRSTIQHWLLRKKRINSPPGVVAFFESSEGVKLLHRIVSALHLVLTLSGPGSVRQVCQFLELSGLSSFVASSYGTQHAFSAKMEEAVIQFDSQEKNRLGGLMSPKEVTVCQDETFHPEPCLVGIEPVSNFILIEKYADSRKSAEWTKAMNEAVSGLPVKVVQSTSDEGRGILHHVKNDLGAHHSPDVFHVQHEISKGTSAVLAGMKKKAEAGLQQSTEAVERCIQERGEYRSGERKPGRPPCFEKRIDTAVKKCEEAREFLEKAETHQRRMKEAVRDIGRVYHPVDLETGKLKDTEDVSASLERCFEEIETVASEANLGERSLKRIAKAHKVVVDMVATILFFCMTVRMKVEALSLAPQVEKAMMEILIPALYIQRVSRHAKSAEERQRLGEKSDALLALLNGENSPFSGLDEEEGKVIKMVAEECAGLFQRSSSCVEGRNGQLSLRHHGLHRLSNRKLAALTAVHNYFIKRRDGTTPAERFFGNRPRDLFEFLLDKLDCPGRPAKRCA